MSRTLEVGEDGETIAGSQPFTIRDPAGTVQSVIPVPLEGERIDVEPMTEVGTPPPA